MPTDGDTVRRWPSISIGALTASSSFCATRAASWLLATSESTTTNSSPPKRETRSESRTVVEMRWATLRSKSSPTWWPSESFTVLKLSRSMNSTASELPRRRAMARALSSRSRRWVRLGNWVRWSCSAKNSMRACALRWLVKSRITSKRWFWPSSGMVFITTSTGISWPSLCRIAASYGSSLPDRYWRRIRSIQASGMNSTVMRPTISER